MKLISRKIAAPLIPLLLMTACGFQPMYGSGANAPTHSGQTVEAGLNDVGIANIEDREGVILRNALIDRFYAKGYPSSPRYTLSFSDITESLRSLDVTKSSEATRNMMTLTTTMTLTDSQNPATPVLTRQLTSVTSYNVLESEFATHVTEDNARVSGLNDIARQTELNLSLFFNRAK